MPVAVRAILQIAIIFPSDFIGRRPVFATFENFTLDTERRELCRDGESVAVEPQVFDLLVCLVSHRDRVVDRDIITAEVWGGRIVSESTLTTRINAVRRALGDSGRDQRLIRTIYGKGFRFVGDVDDGPNLDRVVSTNPAVAVLPFANLIRDPEQQFFADGLTNDIVAALSAWRTFPIVFHNSMSSYVGLSSDIRDVGRQLHAGYVLAGSVRASGEQIRVVVRLVDAMTGHDLWSDKIDGDASDMLALQDQITQRVVTSIKPQLRGEEQRRSLSRTDSALGTWDFYQRGWSCLDEETEAGNARARDWFSRAVEVDPANARALSAISIAHQRDIALGVGYPLERSVERAVRTAEQAVLIDEASARLHATLGSALRLAERFEDSLAHLENAVALDPDNLIARVALGFTLVLAGDKKQGIPLINRAAEIGVTAEWVTSKMALARLSIDEFEPAVTAARKAINDRPRRPGSYLTLAISLAHLRRTDELRPILLRCEQVCPGFAARWQPGFRDRSDNRRMLKGLRMASRAR